MKTITDVNQKKENAEMWDSIDELTMTYIQNLKQIGIGGKRIPEHVLLDMAKNVLEVAVPLVEQTTGEEFEYVDCDM